MKTTLTIEESAKLIELGVDPKLASMEESVGSTNPQGYGGMVIRYKPIFTLADILLILPKEINDGYNLNIDVTGKYYGAAYVCWDEDENGKAVIKNIIFEAITPELIDALYQLLIWVIENALSKGITECLKFLENDCRNT